jgi:serine/threonine protein kinase/Leucine-rich repeat (LRR) protein
MSDAAEPKNDEPERLSPPVSIGNFDGLYVSSIIDPPRHVGSTGTLGEFTLIRQIGAGGMGIVFEARYSVTGEHVAIKLLRPELAASPQAVHRFMVEAGHMKRLAHDHILPVSRIVERPQGPFYVMTYAEGGPLSAKLIPDKPLDLQTLVRVAREIGSALAYAHGQGIIHRDLKPANVLLDAGGKAFLSDFGLVRTVFNDSIADASRVDREGTAPYMSPAVAAGAGEDTRCDIYAFGALLYEMLAGAAPYEGRSIEAIVRQVLAGPPVPLAARNPRAPKALVEITEACMARQLRDRYAEMADVLADLERFEHGQPPRRARARTRDLGWWKLATAAMLLLGCAALLGRKFLPRSPATVAQKSVVPEPAPASAPTTNLTTTTPITTRPTTIASTSRPIVSAIAARLRALSPEVIELHLDDPALVDGDLASLERLTKLKTVELNGTGITDAGLEHLKDLHSLHRLRLDRTAVTGSGLHYLRGLKNLEHLYLTQSRLNDSNLEELTGLSRLHSLYIGQTAVTDRGLACVGRLTRLDTLDLGWLPVTDAGLEKLQGLTVLSTLTLTGTPRITDAGLKHLQKMTKLVALDVRFSQVTGEGLRHLLAAKGLRDLNLGDTPFDDAGAENLRSFGEMRRLILAHTKVGDAGLEVICTLTKLNDLSLCRAKISNARLHDLADLTDLRILDISETAVRDADLEYLGGLTQLTNLNLAQTRITDAGLQHLRGLANLRTLTLANTGITNAGLSKIQNLSGLQSLTLSFTQVTEEGVAGLRQASPRLKITR